MHAVGLTYWGVGLHLVVYEIAASRQGFAVDPRQLYSLNPGLKDSRRWVAQPSRQLRAALPDPSTSSSGIAEVF